MTDIAYNDPDSENTHQTEAKRDGDDVDRLIDEAAMRFARLFWDQCMYTKSQGRKISDDVDHDMLT